MGLTAPTPPPWNPEDLKRYAGEIISDHAKDVEWLSVFEMTDKPISEADASKIVELIETAALTIEWTE